MQSKFPSGSPARQSRKPRRKTGPGIAVLLLGTVLAAVLLVAAGTDAFEPWLRHNGWYARLTGEDRAAPRAATPAAPAGVSSLAVNASRPDPAPSPAMPSQAGSASVLAPAPQTLVPEPASPEPVASVAASPEQASPEPVPVGADAPSGPAPDPGDSPAVPGLDPAWLPLLVRLEADGFSRPDMEALFARLGPSSWSPAFMAAKVTELTGIMGVGVNLSEDAQPEIPEDYEQPVAAVTVGEYRTFLEKYAEDLKIIKQRYGVPANVLTAILLVETGLGSNLGKSPSLLALGSMASTTTPAMLGSEGNKTQLRRVYPPRLQSILRDKSAWAYKELKALIKYGQDSGTDVSKIPGSIYGAVGICQFMPSNIEPYGVDGDKDGVVNLFSVVDAMHSAANYLSEHGWRGARSREQQFRVLLAYNQDYYYAGQVLGISRQLALAEMGKLADYRNPMAGIGIARGRKLDPSLRGRARPPARARIKSLGSYQDLLP